MARIRSIHPGLFTDESYMALSLAGKAVWPGVWTEADDHGVIEWKPLTLKARLAPADPVDMAELLAEFVAKGLLLRFTEDGRQYAVIKGFIKWQRPKEPRYRFPFPQAAKLFAENFSNASPISPQREEEGGRREEGSEANASGADAPDPVKALFDDGVKLLTENGCQPKNARSIIGKWRSEQGDEATHASIKAARAEGVTEPIAWITQRFAGKPRESWDQRRIREAMETIRQ